MLLRTVTLRVALVATTVAATGLGTVTLASTQVLFQLTFLFALALDAFAIAAQAMVGFDLGAGTHEQVRATMRRLLLWGLGSGVALGAILAIAAPGLGHVFSSDAGVIAAVPAGAFVVAATMPLGAIVFVLDGVLIGANDGRYLALAGAVNLIVYLPLLWWAAQTASRIDAGRARHPVGVLHRLLRHPGTDPRCAGDRQQVDGGPLPGALCDNRPVSEIRQVRPKAEGWTPAVDADGRPKLQFASPRRTQPPRTSQT